ncbi:BofC C-terminal domain-containing protein [Cytobacillus sp. Hm23]
MRLFSKIAITSMILFIFSLLASVIATGNDMRLHFMNDKRNAESDVYEVSGPLYIKVILERIYLDGEVSEEIVNETIWSMEDFWALYADWQLVEQNDEQIVFMRHIEDISPLLKANGYFGINDNGVLMIFEGKPAGGSRVIQSFYQIDIGKLESHQHELLKRGIPVESKDKYNQVIEAFKHFQASVP